MLKKHQRGWSGLGARNLGSIMEFCYPSPDRAAAAVHLIKPRSVIVFLSSLRQRPGAEALGTTSIAGRSARTKAVSAQNPFSGSIRTGGRTKAPQLQRGGGGMSDACPCSSPRTRDFRPSSHW